MPYRLASCCSRIFSKQFCVALGIVAAASIFAASFSYATVTITPVNQGYVSDLSQSVSTISVLNSTVYYTVRTGSSTDPTNVLLDRFSDYLNVGYTQDTDSGRNNILLFDVVSSTATADVDSNKPLVLTVSATNGSTYTPVSIATVQGVDCGSTNCQAQKSNNVNTSHYTAVLYGNYQKSTIRIGIYPNTICASYYSQNSGDASGCSSGALSPITGSSGTKALKLRFDFGTAPDNTSTWSSSQDSADITLNFQVSGPAYSCPDLSNIYFPGDGEIELQAGGFSMVTSGQSSLLTGHAPATELLVLGTQGTLDTTSLSQLMGGVSLSGTQTITGFENNVDYDVTFMIRDASSVIAKPPGGGCSLSNLRTTDIRGFLNQSNCFIATAAFRSIDSAPVTMLRTFRDQVLLQTDAGRAFVRWYYDWSPGAAEWLMKHPVFRFPVLLALIPVEILAWAALHPVVLMIWLMASGAVLFGAMFFGVKSRRNRECS